MAYNYERNLNRSLEQLAQGSFPGCKLVSARPFGVDEGSPDATEKALGYGKPILLTLNYRGAVEKVVLHRPVAGDFGHERRADRASDVILAFDTFGAIPNHVRAIDVGASTADGAFVSLKGCNEFFLLTSFVEGSLYADELREAAARDAPSDDNIAHARRLATYLGQLHQPVTEPPSRYVRAIRDLVGHGEGIFGIIDGYPSDVLGATQVRLEVIEQLCVGWRWRLKTMTHRLRRTHGDFHPFNVLFDGAEPRLLDTSRGSMGDAADDVVAMAINYPFFALQHEGTWQGVFRPLWATFWDTYLEATGDEELCAVAAPFLAWRALVLANPRWYPRLGERVRSRLLTWAQRTLESDRFDPETSAEQLFT